MATEAPRVNVTEELVKDLAWLIENEHLLNAWSRDFVWDVSGGIEIGFSTISAKQHEKLREILMDAKMLEGG